MLDNNSLLNYFQNTKSIICCLVKCLDPEYESDVRKSLDKVRYLDGLERGGLD